MWVCRSSGDSTRDSDVWSVRDDGRPRRRHRLGFGRRWRRLVVGGGRPEGVEIRFEADVVPEDECVARGAADGSTRFRRVVSRIGDCTWRPTAIVQRAVGQRRADGKGRIASGRFLEGGCAAGTALRGTYDPGGEVWLRAQGRSSPFLTAPSEPRRPGRAHVGVREESRKLRRQPDAAAMPPHARPLGDPAPWRRRRLPRPCYNPAGGH